MTARRYKGPKQHKFRNKLLLNQWLVSLFGIDPLREHPPPPGLRRADNQNGRTVRPFHLLAEPIKDPRLEGFTFDNLVYGLYHTWACWMLPIAVLTVLVISNQLFYLNRGLTSVSPDC
ncbi:MAG: hypothetical protein K9N52_01405 [Verrucomicrobia bacterium]|nr:hypothetical protein [Verrucomicrobiota bacterium]